MTSVNVQKKPVLCLTGPTASGKTDLATALADQREVDIISVDSTLVYRGLDIASAKPKPSVLKDYPHQLVDILDPAQSYNVATFVADAKRAIDNSLEAGRLPVLVGGSMLYYKALLQGLNELPATNLNVRQEIAQQAESQGWPALHNELKQLDPVSAERIHPNHSQRLSRALEIIKLTGKPLSEIHQQKTKSVLDGYPVVSIALQPKKRETLHQRIEQRLEQIFASGAIEEVAQLFTRQDLHRDLPSVRAVGYQQIWRHLEGEYDLKEAKYRTLYATRQLAKRQLTWMRSWQSLQIIYTHDEQGSRIDEKLLIDQVTMQL